MPKVRISAHAKVNLALALAGPEPPGSAREGWHRICTWMHAIDLADEVLVEPLVRGSASTWSARWADDAPRPGLVDWPVEKDLAWRALKAIERHVGRPLPTRIVLTKRIPTGAGLGGGSSDAAATLVGVDRAWGLGLGLDTLRHLGATLGSDVPFFIDRHNPVPPGVVSGFGEIVERTARATGTLVLLIPHFGCPTGRVYAAFDELWRQGGIGPLRAREVHRMADIAIADNARLFNDLAGPACMVAPGLAPLRAAAAEAIGREPHITGSGSAMFAVVDAGQAQGLADRLRGALPGVAVRVSRLV